MPEFPPYQLVTTCAKCGATGEARTYYYASDSALSRYPGFEHLKRVCARCGYTWPEACLPVPHLHTWSPEVKVDLDVGAQVQYYAPCVVTGCDARIARTLAPKLGWIT